MNTATENTELTPPIHADYIKSITNEGETHICSIINADGSTTHSFLLPKTKADINWKDAMEWAKSIGGDLPTRAELIMLYENHADQFENRAYWSNTQHASDSSYTWCQSFNNGSQHCYNKLLELHARAVRRLAI